MGLSNEIFWQARGENTLEMSFNVFGGRVSPEGKRYAEDEVEMHRTEDWDSNPVCLETGEVLGNDFFKKSLEERTALGWRHVEGDPSRKHYLRKAYWFDRWFFQKLNIDWKAESVLERVPLEVVKELTMSLRKAMEIIGDRYIPAHDEYRITDEQVWSICPGDAGYEELFAMFDPHSLLVPDIFDNWIARDMKETLEWCETVLPRYEAGEIETVWFKEF